MGCGGAGGRCPDRRRLLVGQLVLVVVHDDPGAPVGRPGDRRPARLSVRLVELGRRRPGVGRHPLRRSAGSGEPPRLHHQAVHHGDLSRPGRAGCHPGDPRVQHRHPHRLRPAGRPRPGRLRRLRAGLAGCARRGRPAVPGEGPRLLLRQPDRAAGGRRPAGRSRRSGGAGEGLRDHVGERRRARRRPAVEALRQQGGRRHPDHGERQPPRHRGHAGSSGRRPHERRRPTADLVLRGRERGHHHRGGRPARPHRHRRGRQQGRGDRGGAGRHDGPEHRRLRSRSRRLRPGPVHRGPRSGRCHRRRSGGGRRRPSGRGVVHGRPPRWRR